MGRGVGGLGVTKVEVIEEGQTFKTKNHPSHHEMVALKQFRWIA